jgi:hypothetical protein
MPAASTKTPDDVDDRVPDRVIRQLLFEEPAAVPAHVIETPDPADPSDQAASRAPKAFLVAFSAALLLAGTSWILASSRSASSPGLPVVAEAPAASPASDLLLRMGQLASASASVDGVAMFRQQVGRMQGEVLLHADGRIEAIRIDASSLRALVDLLEKEGLAFLEVPDGEVTPPAVAGGGDWQEWSDRLQVRRALRRVERLGGPLILAVGQPG